MSKATLPALAAAIGTWFPELGGRSIAVSEAEVTKENLPTLPLAMSGLMKETARQNVRSNGPILITEDLQVQFWFAPERYRKADGSESPFWAFYDYSSLRDELLSRLDQWKTPRGYRLEYKGLDIESDHFAVILAFRFEHAYEWCLEPAVLDAMGRPAACANPVFRVTLGKNPDRTNPGCEPENSCVEATFEAPDP